MQAISRSDGSTCSVDTKMASHVAKAAGENGAWYWEFKTTTSKEGRIGHSFTSFKSEAWVLSHGLGRFCDLVWGTFATWSGALSRLGLGCFAQGLGRSCDFQECFRSIRGKRKAACAVSRESRIVCAAVVAGRVQEQGGAERTFRTAKGAGMCSRSICYRKIIV